MRIVIPKAGSILMLALIALAAVSAASATNHAYAAKSSTTFDYLIATGPLCELAEDACPAIAEADNGDTIWITGSGSLTTFPKSASGSGNFTHKNAAGDVLGSGTWTATELVSFISYGDGTPQGFPENFFGGRALIKVTLFVGATPVFTAILWVTCTLGDFPPSAHEGVRLNVQGAINFNKEHHGLTLYILTS